MQTLARKWLAAACAVGVMVSGAGIAGADNVKNDVVAGGNGTITSGGSTTINYYIQDTGNSCDAADGSAATVTITTPTGVTASPSSLTFSACNVNQSVSFSSSSVGTHPITHSVADTAGTYNASPANWTLTVNAAPAPPAAANTAPQVTIGGVTSGASYDKGSVPAATCDVVDTEDGDSSFAATLSSVTGAHASDGIGSQTASCSYTDGGGLTDADSATYNIVDRSAPSIGSALSPATPDGSNGWYKTNVSLTWNVSEPESPNSLEKTGCVDQNVTADQQATSYQCSATSAGGSTDPVTVWIKRDNAKPTNVQFAADVAADGAVYFPNTVPVGAGCTANDDTSGVASCTVVGRSIAVGTHTLTATATDHAGNVETATRTYRVRQLALTGFTSPVDMAALNTVKAGATVPLKFNIVDEGVQQTSTGLVSGFSTKSVACDSSTPEDAVDFVTTGGTTLRYDATGPQFIQNWQTPKSPGKCIEATVSFVDGQALKAQFKLK